MAQAQADNVLKLFRIAWMKIEEGCGPRPDGVSLHTSVEAASEYLREQLRQLPKRSRQDQPYPSRGWDYSAQATPVLVSHKSVVMTAMGDNDSLRVRAHPERLPNPVQRAVGNLKVSGRSVEIDYGTKPFRKPSARVALEILRVLSASSRPIPRCG